MLPDTSPKNFSERMLILLTHLLHAGVSLAPKGDDLSDDKADLGLGVNGTPEANGAGAGMGAPMFMSTATGKPVQLSSTASAMAKAAGDDEASRISASWDALADELPAAMKAIAHREKGLLGRQFMSLNESTGKVFNKVGRERLHFAKELLKASGVAEFVTQLSTASIEPSPALPKPAPETGTKKNTLDSMLDMLGAERPQTN